jgi:predicted RNase H-like HicB family nuclease
MVKIRVIPIAQRMQGVIAVKSYIFRIVLTEEDDGRWSAEVPALPGCATCGDTKQEALDNIRDAAEAYIRDMQNAGEKIPTNATLQVLNEPVVAVTV